MVVLRMEGVEMRGSHLRSGGLLVVALALTLSACATDEAGDYFAAMGAVSETCAVHVSEVGGVGPDSSPEDLQVFFAARSAALESALGDLSAIAPPDDYETQHNQFVEGQAQFAELSAAIAAESFNLESSADVVSPAVHPDYGITPSNAAEAAAVDACKALQGLADDGGVDVDLACEELS